VLNRVLAGEEVTITRHGRPVAVVVRPDALRVRRADQASASAERIGDLLAVGRTTSLLPEGRLTERRAEELIAEVRAGRSDR
jgi:antitoxin (DNA-binding transcriptional repressor) of toxin-antitoxin stability system